MTYVEFAALIRENTHTDTVTLPDAMLVMYANAVLPELTAKVNSEVDEDFFGMIATTDLIADQREYSFPPEMLNKMKMLQVKFTADGEFVPVEEFEAQDNDEPLQESYIAEHFGNERGRVFFDIFRGSLWIYSADIPDTIEGGIELYFLGDTPNLTTAKLASTDDMSVDPSSTTRGMPKVLHELWARRVQIEFKSNREKPLPLTERELSYKIDLAEGIDTMKDANLTRAFTVGMPINDITGNNGFNL